MNTHRTAAVSTQIRLGEHAVRSARSFEIAAPPELEVMAHNADALAPRERAIPPSLKWTFPAASVSAVEIRMG